MSVTEDVNGAAPIPEERLRARTSTRPPWDEEPTAVGQGLKGLALVLICAAVLVPLYTVLLTSLSTQDTITRAGGLVLVPGEITLDAYRQVLSGGVVTRAVLVSVGITTVGTAVSMVVSVLGAYGLSRPGSYGHRTILFTLLITMFFGAGMIPTYLLVSNLGLIDSYWSLILPTAVSAFNVLLLRGFFTGIDASLIDSARIDGAGDWRILTRIVLPMSKAVTAVIALFYAVGYWNAFFQATLYINDSTKQPLQVVLRSFVLQGVDVPGALDVGSGQVASLAVQMAVVVIAIVPVLLVYPFVQKHFSSGVMIGAVKG
ncbi:carbohydrate ABC transporter permease [Kineococcus radiotolerans]|uniref:Binding-protein-dependent transport systems inner membrane component n=1 Tax=Kineococcus radiotolerans (strain ATCC BAA-149 / DSM 14245 / SRS30216) TaxID=266940 RepID=A6W512_KINRD|nr:carbohydrate ABC transporter permease [Kineococcus radiotolerans]ABS01901.1 binding-protein-dependent transport systems inner membrane component [Kineococcus radiotolerans SRS30216 = ATCC BAA-149]